jgi:pimeloyl-ACP methyl ester carboxylesterase
MVVGLALMFAASAVSGQAVPWPLAEARAQYGGAPSRYLTLDGVDVHFKDEGKGPAVLLIHGSYGDLSDWDEWSTRLRPHFRVVRFDMPGYGLTGAVPNGDYSADQTMRLISALMDKLNIRRFAIGGTSSGGPPAFRYAATNPKRVKALIIMNSAGIAFGSSAATPSRPGFAQLTLADITAERLAEPLKALTNGSPAVTPAFIRRKADIARIDGRLDEGKKIVAQYRKGNPVEVLGRIKAPTFVLWGGANKALPASVADDFARGLTGARHVETKVLPSGGHLLHIQMPSQSGEAALRFLKAWGR